MKSWLKGGLIGGGIYIVLLITIIIFPHILSPYSSIIFLPLLFFIGAVVGLAAGEEFSYKEDRWGGVKDILIGTVSFIIFVPILFLILMVVIFILGLLFFKIFGGLEGFGWAIPIYSIVISIFVSFILSIFFPMWRRNYIKNKTKFQK